MCMITLHKIIMFMLLISPLLALKRQAALLRKPHRKGLRIVSGHHQQETEACSWTICEDLDSVNNNMSLGDHILPS